MKTPEQIQTRHSGLGKWMPSLQKGWTVEGSYKTSFFLQYADIRWLRRLMGMKQILVMMTAAVVLVGCSKDTPETSQAVEAEAQVTPAPTPEPVSPVDQKLIADTIVEKAIRRSLKKPEGGLTETDLKEVTDLTLMNYRITDAGLKEVAKLQKLTFLSLYGTKITEVGLIYAGIF